MGKSKKRKKSNRKNNNQQNNNRFLIETKVVKPTNTFYRFIEEIKDILGLSEQDYRITDNDIIETGSMDIKVFQTLITTSFTVVKNEYSLLLTPINDGIYIYLILVQKPFREKGLGKSIMVELTSLSNKLNTPIYLIPVPIPDEDTTYEELVRFYKKCGFNRDKTSRYWKYNPKPDVFKQVG